MCEIIFILNCHGGNRAAIGALRGKLTFEERLPLSIISYSWSDLPTVFEEKNKVIKVDKNSPGVFTNHAGEVETSIQLYLQPDLVDKGSAFWTSGVLGDPSYGTREKGNFVCKL